MKKQLIYLLLFQSLSFQISAQDKNEQEYRDHSKEVATEIWNAKSPEFSVMQVSPELKNESAVIIAKSINVINTAKKKKQFWGGQVTDKLTYDNTIHVRVLINDKAALNEYSSLEYEKQIIRNSRQGWNKLYNQQYTFVGAKVIKPDGKETIVNGDEEVLTVDENKKKAGKLAISGLQVGDILDYYIKEEVLTEAGNKLQGPYTYFLVSDYPVLSLKLHMELDERAGAIYVSANGAPKPTISKNSDGGAVIDLDLKNLSKIADARWTLPMRQYPYVSIEYLVLLDKNADKASDFDRGKAIESEGWETFFKKLKEQYIASFRANMMRPAPLYWNMAKDYYGGKKPLRAADTDSLVKILYNLMIRNAAHQAVSTADYDLSSLKDKIEDMSIFDFSIALDRSDIPHDFLFVAPKTGPAKNNILIGGNSLVPILHIKASKDIWLDFERTGFFSNKIPYWLEGETAEGFTVNEGWKETSYKLPVSTAADNVVAENLEVALLPESMQTLQIKRKTILTGNYVDGTMSDLQTLDGYIKSLDACLFPDELPYTKTAPSKIKEQQKKEFASEIENWFDQDAKEMTGYEVVAHTSNSFSYASVFTMDNWVKKAGNNYIVEAGHLIGSFNKVEEKERVRSIDINMSFARSLQYNITMAIPSGYTVKGLENFNKNLKNETGSFVSNAVVSGDKVIFTVNRVFTNAYQPASNWPKLIELIDASYDFSQQKLLLEKGK